MTKRKYKFTCTKRKCGFKTNNEHEAAFHFWNMPSDHKVRNFDPWTMPSPLRRRKR